MSAGEALVWRTVRRGFETTWLRLGPGRPPTVVARRPGLWLAGRDDLYEWRETARPVQVCSPAVCFDRPYTCQPIRPGRRARAVAYDVELVGLTTRRRVPVGPRMPDTVARHLLVSRYERRPVPLGQLDDRLLVRIDTYLLDCGASRAVLRREHGVVTLPGSGLALVADTAEARRLVAQHREAVRGAFDEASWSQGEVAHVAVHVALDPRGHWQAEHELQLLRPPRLDLTPPLAELEAEERRKLQAQGVRPPDAGDEPPRPPPPLEPEPPEQAATVRLPARWLPRRLAEPARRAPDLRGLELQPASEGGPAGWSWLPVDAQLREALRAAFAREKRSVR